MTKIVPVPAIQFMLFGDNTSNMTGNAAILFPSPHLEFPCDGTALHSHTAHPACLHCRACLCAGAFAAFLHVYALAATKKPLPQHRQKTYD
jgi:hypothetical protein